MKHQFDLQYFAEDNTDSVDESAVTEKESSEPKKTDNLKYSDKDLDEILSKKFAKWQEKKQKEVDSFSTAFSKAVEDAVKERLKGNPPHKGSGTPAKMTKDQIMDIKDPVERQRLINENRDLFGY